MSKSVIEWAIIQRVKSIRKTNRFTQRQIANLLGVTPGYIGQIESQKSSSKYTFDQLNTLAKHFGCTVRDFIPEVPV